MLDSAIDLAESGFSVIWLKYRSKMPVEAKWSTQPTMSVEEIENGYEKGRNIGVRLGKWSRIDGFYLHALDMDVRDTEYTSEALGKLADIAEAWGITVSDFVPVVSGSGGDSRHFYFLSDKPFKSKKLWHTEDNFVDDEGRKHWCAEIELFGTGKQVALPPSIHPDTLKPYVWENGDFDAGALVDVDASLIEDMIGAEREQNYDDVEPLGINYIEAEEHIADLDLDAYCEDRAGWVRLGMALHHEFDGSDEALDLWRQFSKKSRKFKERVLREQWESFKLERDGDEIVTFASIIHAANQGRYQREFDEVVDEFVEDDDFDRLPARKEKPTASEKVTARKSDPDMSLLRQSRVDPPAFPIDIFGPVLADAIKNAAEMSAAPVDYVVAAVLTGAASAIGNTTRVQLRKGYVQPAIIWSQIIGLPSSLKSPALRVVTGVLNSIQIELEQELAEEKRMWLRRKEATEMRRKAWEAQNKAMLAADYNADLSELPEDCVVPPEPPGCKLIINDMTIEAFLRAQARNPRGFMVFRDELSGWLASMERYNSTNAERPIWLESYDGGSYVFERVKDEGRAISAHKLFAPILGGIQPDRLLEITRDSSADDGLQARFIPFWPENEHIPLADEVVFDSTIERVLRNLTNIELERSDDGVPEPYIVEFTRKAWETWKDWREQHRLDELRAPTKLQSMYGKADGLVGRLALILEYLWWASEHDEFDDDIDPPGTVSVKAVKAAIRMREEYIKVMQRRVIDHSIEPLELTNARLIAQWIIDKDIESFNASDMRRSAGIRGISGRTPIDVVNEALLYLTEMRWIRPESKRESGKGRPSRNFIVNERLWDIIR